MMPTTMLRMWRVAAHRRPNARQRRYSHILFVAYLVCLEFIIVRGFGPPLTTSNFVYPRRRSSSDGYSSQMQSRAVDTRVQLEVLENEMRGTVVGYIPTKIGFTYRFNEPPREFTLDPNTGEIKTNAILDREERDRYDLVVLSSQPTYPIEVRITVSDTNDNSPEFPEPSIAVTFSESAAPGTRLLLDAATDRDIGVNSVTDDYGIVMGNFDEKFRLVVTTNPSGDVSYLHLETTGKLDREVRGAYVLNVSARDGGKPPRKGYLQVNVTVLDVNDNPPIFDHSDYIVSLNESVRPGTPVLQVMASDSDLGDNSALTYYLSEMETQFTVDPETGVISTTEHLSCPHQQNCATVSRPGTSCPKSCVFTVFARDHGSPRQDGRTYVTVNLVDTNDHDPVIRFQYFPLTGTFATVDENAANSSVVAAIYVVDMDEGLNGATNIRIVSGNELQHFRLENTPSFDIVRVNGVLDREEISKYNLTIMATDKGTPPRTATAYLIIHVNDVNDHEPVFEKSEYSVVLSELTPIGTYVASITATDEDTGVNAQIFYDFVSGNAHQWFRIDTVSGLITTQAMLDREIQGTVELNISARDGGPNPRTTWTQLKVTVLDENDEAPKFAQNHINVSLSENAPPNTLVAMLTAADHDQGTNGSVTYSLGVNQKYPNMFALDTATGQLTTKTKLDRETIAFYEIEVVARDQGIPMQSSTATVSLIVEDVNDSSPEFYPKRYFVAVAEDTPPDTSLLQVTATDADEGTNAAITYNLESGGNSLFAVDSRTGVISLRAHLRSSQQSLHRLLISAKDTDNRRSEEDAIVEIMKESKLEELEFDAYGGYEFQIDEDFGRTDERIGREVGRTRVRGKGSDASSIEYSIVQGDPNGNFEIDLHSGIITTATIIDRETTMLYSLTVAARSGMAYGRTTVAISVLDLNDNSPQFMREHEEIQLAENAAVGHEVYLCRARDKDSGPNSRIAYSLSFNPDEQFRIGETTGVLYLNRPLRAEPDTQLTVEIMAKDGGVPSLSAKSTITISITDCNDHTPVFDHTSYETSLSESTPVNSRFFALTASDADLGANGRIRYEIVEGNAKSQFGIFPDGYMFVKKALDREDRDYYSLVVQCTDDGLPSPRSSTVPVIIHIIDENDNVPQFTNTTFSYGIYENEPADSFVGKLTAIDRDIGRNAELIYSLAYAQSDFTIDPRNGFIKTTRPFDREQLVQSTGHNSITLEASVSDNGAVRLRDTVKVKIHILDLNDNRPKFVRTPYKVQISEGSPIGTQLIRIYTVDIDEGLNGDTFYFIADGNTDGRFAIEGATGQVTLARQLDRESVAAYQLTVVAHDAATKNQLSANTTVSIEVLDENDNEPLFTQTNTQISVNETTAVGTELMRFRATDSDLGANSKIQYSISAGNRRDTFHIDSLSGTLLLHKPLDYEETTSYNLNITATDGGNPSLSTTIVFNVMVKDENDNRPNFPNTAIVRQIKEGISLKTPIVTVIAEDPDSGANGKVNYALVHQDPSDMHRHFDINQTTGVIYTLRQIDRETIDTFKLTIVATDQAMPPSKRLSAEKIVTVIVEDINDNAPIFVSMNAAVLPPPRDQRRPSSMSRGGSIVMNVFARDADSGTNGLVTYEMVSGNTELFKLHRSTGAISLQSQQLDRTQTKYLLSLKATDEAVQNERKSSDAYVTLIVRGRHIEEGPVFERMDLHGSVYENEPIGTSIVSVAAHLNGTTDIEYYVTNVTGNGKQVDRMFDIDPKSGILSTAVELDRESGIDVYEIEVYAIAADGTPRTSNTKIKVNVQDKNDSPPVFADEQISFEISEDLRPGHTIGIVNATDPDTIGALSYTLESDDAAKTFELDKSSGVLKLIDTLDREKQDMYKLAVRASDGVQATDTTVLIQVTDSNDNPPSFSKAAYSFDVPENAPRGYQVGIIAATDPDQGANADVSYAVISDWANDVFSLNPQTGVFTLSSRLDYEEVQHYILVVQAQDSGHPSLSTTITVYCNVLDLNDNSPAFDPMSYSNEIYENVTVGTDVITVSATDIDSGLNGRIEYSITGGDENDDFEIGQNGTIRTRRMLDRETIPSYSLIVTARDMAIEPEKRLSSTVQVTVQLKDVNDMSPEFTSSSETNVRENTPPNTIVMAIKAVDRDEGRNGYIEYILATDPSVPFSLGPVDGLLRISGRLDREIQSSYKLMVTARDRGEPPRSTHIEILVKILDENDNSPVFDPKQYSSAVAENASIGAMVLQVSATDIDEGANGRIRYLITDGDENHDFIISEDSGILRVAKNLNYERKSRYVLTVRAEDCASDIIGNGESRYDTAELTIAINDINDNPPIFLDSPYLAYVMENIVPPNGGYVITVQALDVDTPPFNNQVRYFLKEGDSDLFRINASSGEISLMRALDREEQAEYSLTLVAMDSGSPPLTGTGTVRVIVQDMNDHSPVFERQSYRTTVEENLPIGTTVLAPNASDKDAGLNAKLRFSLLGENFDSFRIDHDTGVITTAVVLDRELTNVYYMTLMAQDSSTTEPRATAVNLTIVVSDINDNSPAFEHTSFSVTLPDQTRAKQFVFGAHAADRDQGHNSRIIYAISGKDANLFSIENNTGIIKTVAELTSTPHETERVFNLLILASDQGEQPRSTSAELSIQFQPSHLFPQFSYLSQTDFYLPEDIPEGKLVTKIQATSPKKGGSATIKYAIAGGRFYDALAINAESGEISIAKTGLDYELSPIYEFWIKASDSDRPSLGSVIKLILNVSDSNDNAPEMEKSIYHAEVLEEETPPLLVTRVTAHDADSGENGIVTYRLVNDFDGSFEIDVDSGEIFTLTKLDREEIANYELTVEAVDQGMPQQIGTTSVLVRILDRNDKPPRFTRLFSVNVTENSDIGTFVIRVTSSDLDEDENANATYSFTENPGNKFSIDPISGNVTVAGHLDREQQDEFILKVTAFDGAWRAETPLTITIQDQNDNAPEFEHSYYSFNFPELQPNVSVVGQVIATDRDKQGPNAIISYSLQQPSEFFRIDPATGEVFSKQTLHYRHSHMVMSPENMYALTVLATDNGKPPMYTECLVNVNIVDANNNAPKFEHDEYLSPVPKDAVYGQRIVQVVAVDELDFGINAEIDYAIVAGNGTDKFAINKADGWISASKSLARELDREYLLIVRAIDRGVPPQFGETKVKIVVTGENRYSPAFTALSYQVIVPENEPIGSTILTVNATDGDDGPNGMVRYSISGGNERKEFGVNAISGAITIMQPLDYDLIQEYHVNITAVDLGFLPKKTVAMLTVTLTDINDNAPEFNQSMYRAYLAENAAINSFVYKVLATDRDSPRNAIIRYSIVGDKSTELFSISPVTGTITSKVTFDYEEESEYELTVLAKNPDSSMASTTKVIVGITGVNEYFPHFVQPVFHFDVSESANIGTSVGVIQATDKDAGDDGKVYYLLVGSSNDKGFSINCETGLITVARNLDRETQSRVVLTVMAKNFGSIRGNDTDEAQVIISIQDGNDPPEFSRDVYEGSVSEGAAIGTKVLTVKAVDKDVRFQNNQFSYSIIGGNANQTFKVEPQLGHISTAMKLDRETIAEYSILIGAIDTGIPPQTGTATVRITITDINDNGPVFAANDKIGFVSENEPIGTNIMTLSASDPDLPPNGAPFTYYLIGGRHKSFVTVDKITGMMKANRIIDRETTPQLELLIEVEDSGTPRMRSQHDIRINIIDQNDIPSTPRTARILVYAFNHKIPIGKIADVKPNDLDTVGDYKCKLLMEKGQPVANGLIIPNQCNLHTTSTTSIRKYSYSISGNDGRHADVVSTFDVDFAFFDNKTIENSITIHVANLTAESFLTTFYGNFIDLMQSALDSGDTLMLYGLNDHNATLDITVAVKKSSEYRSTSYVTERLSKKADAMAQLLQVPHVIVAYSPCNAGVCDNNGMCSDQIHVYDELRSTDSQTLIITSPLVSHDFTCKCADGFTGAKCDKRQDPCQPNPCQLGSVCRRQGYDFQCICPAHREGKLCHLERGDACSSIPCKNGGSCRESPDGSSFFCLCRPGYQGNQCETVSDSCRPNPCLHGGLCITQKSGYKCSCSDGRYGRHCERATFGFEELSFMTFASLDAATNDISIVLATTKPNALLLYNYGTQSGGRSDFVAIEIVRGKAVFSFGASRTAITSISTGGGDGVLSNGRWHKITATRNGRVMSLSVAKCTENGDVCDECRPGDVSCYADDVGPTGTLNFNKHPLHIGGLSSADPVLERPAQLHADDFVGCIHSVSVNGRPLNMSNPISSKGISPTCNRKGSEGACSTAIPQDATQLVCGAFSECSDRWDNSMCRCGGDLLSPDCYNSLDPVSLGDGGFLEMKISDKYRRMQLLEQFYTPNDVWANVGTARSRRSFDGDLVNKTLVPTASPSKSMSILFRTLRPNGLLLYTATNKHYTVVELRNGKVFYQSKQSHVVNMTVELASGRLDNGKWHNVTLHSSNHIVTVFVDGQRAHDEFESSGVHDFADPYLGVLSIGGIRRELAYQDSMPFGFEGCLANFTMNNEIQPFNGSGSVFKDVMSHGKVYQGCHNVAGIGSAQTTDPLSIGITLVIIFFVILLVAIFGSFVVFRLRKQYKEKSGSSSVIHGKHSGAGSTLLSSAALTSATNDCVMSRSMHVNDASVGYHGDNSDLMRPHHLGGPELLTKKYKERDLNATEHQRPQRPDIIEREVVSKSPPLRDEHHPPIQLMSQHHSHDHPGGHDLSEFPEHYDLENASSIAPSDIDVVFHYKGYREAGNMRKYKATPPPITPYGHHKHAPNQQQHRHSPHNTNAASSPPLYHDQNILPGLYRGKNPVKCFDHNKSEAPQTSQSLPPTATRQHQSTPLARLSPSSELSSQHPRILTLHDISGKPLQSALLATTSSSGGVGKDALNSNSERSLNSPVMSQLSGQSSSASRTEPGPPPPQATIINAGSSSRGSIFCAAIKNTRKKNCNLKNTRHSGEVPDVSSVAHHLNHMHHSSNVDAHSSTSSDESGNDSFTCSEIEYDNASLNAEKFSKNCDDGERNHSNDLGSSTKTLPLAPPSYDNFDSSFRGSLSTLVASDEEIPNHISGIYRQQSSASPSTLGWDYLLNWGLNFEKLMGVFNDIAELPDTVNGLVPSIRHMPTNVQKSSEEYV